MASSEDTTRPTDNSDQNMEDRLKVASLQQLYSQTDESSDKTASSSRPGICNSSDRLKACDHCQRGVGGHRSSRSSNSPINQLHNEELTRSDCTCTNSNTRVSDPSTSVARPNSDTFQKNIQEQPPQQTSSRTRTYSFEERHLFRTTVDEGYDPSLRIRFYSNDERRHNDSSRIERPRPTRASAGGEAGTSSEQTPLLIGEPRPSRPRGYSADITHTAPEAPPPSLPLHRTYTMTSLRDWLADISLPVYLLTMFFAVASWVDINGLWVEVPLLVTELPEGWALPSYLVIIIQVANIGPLTYTIANRLAPNKVREWPVIYGIIAVGAASCLLLAFFWRETTVIGGEEHSTALLALSTSLALVDCTSSVVFLPYMAAFKPQYMTAYYIGEGLSGLIPGLVGLAQGVGGDPICRNTSFVIHNDTTGENHTEWVVIPEYAPPNFSVEVFFFFLCGLIVLSGVCFSFLHFSPMCRKEMINSDYSYDVSTETDSSDASTPEKGVPDPELDGDFSAEKIEIRPYRLVTPAAVAVETSNIHLTNHVVPTDRDDDGKDFSKPGLTGSQLVYLLVVTGWVNALTNGVLPSTQSYSALPYGNLAYTLSVRLGTVANPLACFLALLLPTSSLPAVGVLAGLGSVLAAYQLTLAAMSPTPPLQGEVMGDLLVILTFVVLTGLFSYTKVTVASLLQASGGRRALLWCGGVTQIGSFIGAIITFVLVNILKVFKDTYPCT